MANEQEIGKLIIRLVAEVGGIKKGLQDTQKQVKEFVDSNKKGSEDLKGTIGDIKTAVLGYAAVIYSAWATIKKVWNWAEIGAQADAVQESFHTLTRSMNIDGDALAAKIRQTSYVFVEQTGAMVKAQRLLIEGVSPNQVVKLTEASRVAARLMGVDVEEAFNRISEAVITLRTRGLKAAFPMDVAEVTENYARSLGTVTKYLNEAGNRQAIVNEILRQAKEKTDLLGGALQPNLSEKIQRIKSGWSELQEVIGKGIAVSIEPIITALSNMITMIEKAQQSWQTMPEIVKVAIREMAVTAAMLIPGVGNIIAMTIRASQLKETAKAAGWTIEEVMKEQDAAIAAGLKVQEDASKKNQIDQRKLQEDLTKFRLANEEQMIAARNEIIKSGLEAQRATAIAEAKRTSEDTTLIEMAYDQRMAQEELRATKATLAIKQREEVEAAKVTGMDVANVNQKFRELNLAAEKKFVSEVAKINAKLTQERAEALRKAEQIQFGITFEMEPFAPTALQTGEMDVRSKNLQLKKDEYDIGRKIAETQMEEKLFRISKETALRSEIDLNNQLLATYEVELENLGIGSEGYSDLQSKIAGTRDKVNELNFSLKEQTASFTELADLGLKKYAVSLKDNLINSIENIVPNAIDIAGNSLKGFLKNLSDGTMSASEALKQFAKDFGTSIMDMIIDVGMLILKMEILKALGYGTSTGATAGGGGGGGGGWGGILNTIVGFIGGLFQTGGLIRGPSGADVVPIRGTAGEYMQPVPAVRYYGLQAMEAIRSRAIPRERFLGLLSGIVPPRRAQPSFALAAGGPVPSEYSQTEKGKVELTFINVSDPRDIDRYLSSAAGQNAVLNVLSSRADTVKKIMR